MCSSFSTSPSIRRETGMPVHLADDLGDVLRVTSSLQHPRDPSAPLAASSPAPDLTLQLRQLAILRSCGRRAHILRALRLLDLLLRGLDHARVSVLHVLDDLLLLLPVRPQRRRLLLQIGQLLLQLDQALLRRRIAFPCSAPARSISSCMIRRSISSSSVGMLSISMRSREAASSIRSMALSGRNRSVI